MMNPKSHSQREEIDEIDLREHAPAKTQKRRSENRLLVSFDVI